jgi:hypothetical protein
MTTAAKTGPEALLDDEPDLDSWDSFREAEADCLYSEEDVRKLETCRARLRSFGLDDAQVDEIMRSVALPQEMAVLKLWRRDRYRRSQVPTGCASSEG